MIPARWLLYLLAAAACLIVPAGRAHADPRLDAVRSRYEAAGKLENNDPEGQFRHTMTYNTMQAAIGLQTTVITFFKMSNQVDPEEDPYLQTHELFKITVTYNIAAGAFYTIEYLYDSQGALLFYYWKEDVSSPPQEKRYYYTRGTLFRAVVDYESDNAQRMKYSKDKDFSTEDLRDAARMVKKAADYKRLFETLVTAEQWR